MQIVEMAAQAPQLAALRRIHAASCALKSCTADLVAAKLNEWGIEHHRGLGKTGVVGVIHGRDGGGIGRALGLRADMDALPMQRRNTFAHASRFPARCTPAARRPRGHAAGLAQRLAATRDFDGTVYLIFQPAEEGGGGARVMIEDGLFERFPCRPCSMHNWPGMAASTMAVSAGPVMASTSEFKITVRGKGCHAAMPHLGADPVVAACQNGAGLSKHHQPQQKAAGCGGDLRHHGAWRRGEQRCARQLRAARHGAYLHHRSARPDRAAYAPSGRIPARLLPRSATWLCATTRPPSTAPPKRPLHAR